MGAKMNHYLHIELQVIVITLVFCLIALYLLVVMRTNRHLRKWSSERTLCWIVGMLLFMIAIHDWVHHRPFVDHMIDHLLVGMISPLLIVWSAPLTLLLRSLPVKQARLLTKFLRSPFISFYHHPIVAAVLNIGGLWFLYGTNLLVWMHQSVLLNMIVHLHLFLAGYLFTAAIISVESISSRFSFLYRAVILLLAMAGHAILSKWIFAHPPMGVPSVEAEMGGMLMYYGGDFIELILIVLLCLEWYRSIRPRWLIARETTLVRK